MVLGEEVLGQGGATQGLSGQGRRRTFLFLQGPISPFFPMLAAVLERNGHRVLRINFCAGDRLFWRRPGGTDYRGRVEAWAGFIRGFLQREAVTDLLLLGEQRLYHKTAIAEARRLGVAVMVTDLGYFRPDWIVLEPDGMAAASSFPREPSQVLALAVGKPMPAMAQRYQNSFFNHVRWDLLHHLANSLFWPWFPHFQTHHIDHPLRVYLGTGLRLLLKGRRHKAADQVMERLYRDGAPFFLFPLQLEKDFQLRAYSSFKDLPSAITPVIRSFAAQAPAAAHLVVKLHPADPGLRNWRRLITELAAAAGVAERVHYLDGGTLDAMLARTQGVVTINSTVGISALHFGRPVIALGRALYNIPGLCFPEPLDAFWQARWEPDPALARAFLIGIAETLQIRGVFYREPGLTAAVTAAAARLERSPPGNHGHNDQASELGRLTTSPNQP